MSDQNNLATVQAISEPINTRLAPAILAGAAAALIGAVIWAVVTVTIKYQIGFMAIGVGFLVGYAVRTVGRGSTMPFSITGAVLALLGCVLGNVFSTCGFVAIQESVSVWEILSRLNSHLIVSIVSDSFDGMSLLFYAIAGYEGFKLSVNPN